LWFEAEFGFLALFFNELCYNPRTQNMKELSQQTFEQKIHLGIETRKKTAEKQANTYLINATPKQLEAYDDYTAMYSKIAELGSVPAEKAWSLRRQINNLRKEIFQKGSDVVTGYQYAEGVGRVERFSDDYYTAVFDGTPFALLYDVEPKVGRWLKDKKD
jgi:hypothetical protein